VVLEDTDMDGVADKSTVFVQDPYLVAPMGIGVIDNQIYVSQTPDIIRYTDVNRNLVFDEVDTREVFLTGFIGSNHDHSTHSVIGGPDGKLYFNQGNCGAKITDGDGHVVKDLIALCFTEGVPSPLKNWSWLTLRLPALLVHTQNCTLNTIL
jgi:glucose/arabinose dehydrogenase